MRKKQQKSVSLFNVGPAPSGIHMKNYIREKNGDLQIPFVKASHEK